ncbi:lipid asymmetry maintenance protein MlaB [Zoogloea sp.]|uniref:STAS domain-containing protein n=1 Tax=Zoogloea sp. TaxID=49181 RepID=UPI0035B4AF36|nr:STAS domain-containing protein [Rhodocyclales bacterium]
MSDTPAGCLKLSGPLTLAEVGGLLDDGRAQIAQGLQVLDLSAVTQVDSAALALLLAWLRSAREAGRSLSIVGAPPALQSLASLYDVDSILPLA